MRKCLALALGLLFALALFGCSFDADNLTNSQGYSESDYTTADRWWRNEYGLSCGDIESVVYPPGTSTEEMIGYFPDLVYAVATNGVSGYVWSAELLTCSPSGHPAMMKALSRKGSYKVYIPVYEADGVTEVGLYEFGVTINADWR